MKTLVRILSLILVISSIVGIFASCQKEDKNDNKNEAPEVVYQDYTVTIVDDYGDPVRDVMVRFINSAGEIKSRLTFEDGVATYKNAVAGKYTIVLEKGSSVAIFDQTEYQLTAENNTLEVVVRNEKKTVDIYGDAVPEGGYAHIISEGRHGLNSEANTTEYFLLNVYLPGKYKVSFESSDIDMTVGYYGNPMFVQTTHRGDGEYTGRSFELDIRDVLAPYVIGLNYTVNAEATLIVERIGDASFDPNFDVPVVVVDTKRDDLAQFNLPPNTDVRDFDITDPTLSVTVDEDGYYYTSKGERLYLRITTAGNESNMITPLPSLKSMLALGADPDAPVTIGGINFGGYVYDEDGNYVENRIYNDMISSYYEVCDGRYGLYPLTEELAEAIQIHGEKSGWWDMDNENTCIFNSDVYAENAWLFFCCTLVAGEGN